MKSAFILILILFIVYFIYEFNHTNENTSSNNSKSNNSKPPVYLNIDMKALCSGSDCISDSESDCESDSGLYQKKSKKTIIMPKDSSYDYDHYNRYTMDDAAMINKGDDRLTVQMISNQKKSKQSLNARSLWNSNSLRPYIEEELREAAGSCGWWSDENLEQAFIYQDNNTG